MNSADWHAERLTGIGASDMTNLFELPSPYSTIPAAAGCLRRLWYDKSGIEPDFPRIEKPSMQRGTDCEEIVARKLAAATGWRVTKRKTMLWHPYYPFLIAHVDRECVKPRNHPTLPGGTWKRLAVECKTMNGHVARKVERDGLNDGYLLQMQAILLAGDGRYQAGVFAVLNMDEWDILPPIFIEHDYAVQQQIRDRAGDLWTRVRGSGLPPERKRIASDPVCQECQWRVKCHQAKS